MAKKKTQQRLSEKRKIHKEMDLLFLFAPPKQLKRSLHEVYSLFLQNIDTTLFHPDFNDIAMDFYFLHHFLEKADKYKEES